MPSVCIQTQSSHNSTCLASSAVWSVTKKTDEMSRNIYILTRYLDPTCDYKCEIKQGKRANLICVSQWVLIVRSMQMFCLEMRQDGQTFKYVCIYIMQILSMCVREGVTHPLGPGLWFWVKRQSALGGFCCKETKEKLEVMYRKRKKVSTCGTSMWPWRPSMWPWARNSSHDDGLLLY